MNIHKIYGFFMNYFRPRRIRMFRAMFPEIDQGATVLDIGGTPGWWEMVAPIDIRLTILNVEPDKGDEVRRLGYRFVHGDGCSLPFGDEEFDLVVSNSVIEHVGSLDDQEAFAREAMRCGKHLYLQTPNRWFPIEPHLIAFGVHWLPNSIARYLVRWFSIWGLTTRPTARQVDEFFTHTRLLTRREVVALFPGCRIGAERVAGLTKSFLVTSR